jgi:beta-glucosidase
MPLNPIPCVRRSLLVGALLLASISTFTQFVANDAGAVDKRVNELVGAMTLDEKIDLLSGGTPFRTHQVPRRCEN